MARAAIQTGRNVGGIGLCIHTGRRDTVARVAPCTVGHGTMIERCRNEASSGMTDATILISLNMAIYFTLGKDAVMAGLAVIDNADMLKGPRYKARGLVAHTAIIISWHVCAVFSCGGITIVT